MHVIWAMKTGSPAITATECFKLWFIEIATLFDLLCCLPEKPGFKTKQVQGKKKTSARWKAALALWEIEQNQLRSLQDINWYNKIFSWKCVPSEQWWLLSQQKAFWTRHTIYGLFLGLFLGTAGFLPCNTEVADTLLYWLVNRVQARARELFLTTIWEHTNKHRGAIQHHGQVHSFWHRYSLTTRYGPPGF